MNIFSLSGFLDTFLISFQFENKNLEFSLDSFFKQNKTIGSKERKLIKELIFAWIRYNIPLKGLSFHFVNNPNSNIHNILNSNSQESNKEKNEKLALLHLSIILHFHISYLDYENLNLMFEKVFKRALVEVYKFLLERLAIANFEQIASDFYSNHSINPIYFESFPEIIFQKTKCIGLENDLQLAKEFNKSANLHFRNNTLSLNSYNFEELLKKDFAYLEKNQETFYPNKFIANSYYCQTNINLTNTNLYKKGALEIQDSGSQLICYAAGDIRHKKILEPCAGAGGKSLLLSLLSQNTAHIHISDISHDRLMRAKERIQRGNFLNINIQQINENSNEEKLNKFSKYFDLILIDAPCTSSGTFRRNPGLKYTISQEEINEISRLQLEILKFYKQFLSPNGKIIYATCSIFDDENQNVVMNFLENNQNFKLSNFKDNFDYFKMNLPFDTDSGMINILPNKLDSDAYFIAILENTTI